MNPSATNAPAEIIAAMKTGIAFLDKVADEIGHLPVTQVDEDLVNLATDYFQFLKQTSLDTSEMLALYEQDQRLQQASTSIGVMIEAIARGALGDPLGKANEFATASQKLGAKAELMLDRFANTRRRGIELDAREVKFRAVLSQRYGQEFPPLFPPTPGSK